VAANETAEPIGGTAQYPRIRHLLARGTSWYAAGMSRRVPKSHKRAAKGYTIGRAGFAKISAVEGIRTTAAMDEDFREFDRKGLSAEDRRRVISSKYGKVR
jgi:hypothetical protein